MACFDSFLGRALAVIVLVALAQSGSAAEKLATCCKTVTKEEITEPILGYLVQKRNPPCVQAVIFQTEKGLFCSYLRAPWVARKINEFRARTTAAPAPTSPPTSLLSIITASAGVSSSSPSSSPSSSSSPRPSAETGSGME